MEDVLKVIVENLVENKDAIKIVREDKDDGFIKFKVTVAQDEMGKKLHNQLNLLWEQLVAKSKRKLK